MTRGRKTYRVEIRRPAKGEIAAGRVQPTDGFVPQTRKNTMKQAKDEAVVWEMRGFETRIVPEG